MSYLKPTTAGKNANTDGKNPKTGSDIHVTQAGFGVVQENGYFEVLDALPVNVASVQDAIKTGVTKEVLDLENLETSGGGRAEVHHILFINNDTSPQWTEGRDSGNVSVDFHVDNSEGVTVTDRITFKYATGTAADSIDDVADAFVVAFNASTDLSTEATAAHITGDNFASLTFTSNGRRRIEFPTRKSTNDLSPAIISRENTRGKDDHTTVTSHANMVIKPATITS